MDKRGIRYQQAERMTTAEGKVKRLRLENEELRKALFRATESARIANEEATARAVAQRQSGEALRAQLAELRSTHAERVYHWTEVVRDYGNKASAFDSMPLWRIAAQRLTERLRRSA